MKLNYYSKTIVRLFKGLTFLIIPILAFSSCVESDEKPKDNIQAEMKALMSTLQEAVIEVDAEMIISLCLESTEFLFTSDGLVMTYDQFVEAEIEGFKEIESHAVTWDTLYIKVLGSDVVSALAPFHQKYTLKDGTVFYLKGEVTWVATQTNDGLKLIYGHARHEPDTATH